MVPGLGLDRHVNVRQPFGDDLPFSIKLRGWVGQRPKSLAPAALEKQQQDQYDWTNHHREYGIMPVLN